MKKRADEFDLLLSVLSETTDIGWGESKEIECPKCKNKLHIQKSAYNGHIFAKCETENCICIIQ